MSRHVLVHLHFEVDDDETDATATQIVRDYLDEHGIPSSDIAMIDVIT